MEKIIASKSLINHLRTRDLLGINVFLYLIAMSFKLMNGLLTLSS